MDLTHLRRKEMSEQTVPDIYEWIKAVRERHEAIVEVEADLTAPDPDIEEDEDD